jgi:hypothetical protein
MNSARVVTHYQIAGLLGKAYLKAATVGVAVNGLRRTGLFPYNRHIFHESEFLQVYKNISGCEETEHALPGPSCIVQSPVASVTSPDSEETSSRIVMPSDISHIPDIRKPTAHNISERRVSSRCGAAVLLTSSSYKNQLPEDLEKNAAKDKKKEGSDKMKGGVK